MTKSRALWLMVACLLLAALLRFPELEEAPPGLHYDEAANASLAADIGLRGERPLFIASYTGKEVLFFYAAGGLMRLLGESVFALRLTSAFLGLLTIAATYWLGRALLADRRVAVIAAALLAISFWHLLFSRLGFRAISEPLLQALSVAALFQGLGQAWRQKRSWHWFVLAGFFLGLTAYTYLAARLFPLPLGLALLPLFLDRATVGKRLRQVGLTALVALLVLAPLLLYFYHNPDAFWVRIQQVGPQSGAGILAEGGLLNNYLRSLGMFFLVGDPYWRFNLPGRPLFNWLWGGLLVTGWLVALLRWRRWWYDWQKAAVLLLLLVPFLMVLPTALATGEIIPSNLRAIGLIPFIFYLPALGLVTLLEQIADLLRQPGEGLTSFLRYLNILEAYDINYAFVTLLILLLGGTFTTNAYFQEWATRSDLFYESDADLVALSQFLDDADIGEGTTVYVAAEHYRHPTVAFLSERYEQVKWLPGAQALVLPPQGVALYVYPHSSPAPPWVQSLLEDARRVQGEEGPDEEPLYTAFFLENAAPALAQVADAAPGSQSTNFGDVVTLLGQETGTGAAGATLPLTLYWRVEQQPPSAVRPFVHLEDQWGSRWGQIEPDAYPTEQWQAGELIIQRVDVPVPPGTPPGGYRLRVGLFEEQSGRRLQLLDAQGRLAGDTWLVEGATVARGAPPTQPPTAPRGMPQTVRTGLQLLGYDMAGDTVATGTRLPLTLWWWASEPQPQMTVRLELLRGDNTGVILLNTQPVHGEYPFQAWETPLFLRDEVNPEFPLRLQSGDYRLHLRLLDAAGDTVFTSSLGSVAVEETERTFTRPEVEYPLAARFASEIALQGYNIEQLDERRYQLQLLWQALQEPATDYTVFVHVLNQDGTCCLWQQDVMPQQGRYPTGRWIENEYVLDEYQIEIPAEVEAGEYPVEVGLYVAETFRRLSVSQAGMPQSDVVFLRPLSIE